MNKNNLKKLLLKNHNRFLKIYQEFYNIDLDAYFCDKAEASDFETNNKNEVIFKIDDLGYFDDIDQILLENNILNQKTIEAVKQEFNKDRIDSSFHHCADYIYSEFGKGGSDFNDLFFYEKTCHKTGRVLLLEDVWRFESDAYKSWIELEINASNKLIMLDLYDSASALNLAYNANKYGLRVYFERGRTLQEAVYFQFEILKATIQEINLFKREFTQKLEVMQQKVNDLNVDLHNAHKIQLEQDILDFIDENDLIIKGDVKKIKFDYIAKIEDGQITTNKGAVVPIEDAKNVLNKFLKGVNVTDQKIGAFTVNKIFEIQNTVFLRIGCHLIKIDNQLKQQLS